MPNIHTAFAVDPHEKMRSAFRTGCSANLKRDLLIGEPFIEKHAISNEVSNINREKHKLKSHRVCRRDREPSRKPIRSLKSQRNRQKG